MKQAIAKKEIESTLRPELRNVFARRANLPAETLAAGIAELDGRLSGFPRGAITEIHGPASSGRTSLLCSALVSATTEEEICALVDCSDTFDISSAAKAGVDFNRLLWIRGDGNLERAFKAADLLLHAGGFGLVALNLSDVPGNLVRRIISSWWFRFQRAVENTPAALIVITPVACVRSCAALILKMKNEAAVWSDTLSLVSENGNDRFTREDRARHLSLVTTPTQPILSHSLISHSHFLQKLRISVIRERPLELSGGMNFSLHTRS